MRELPGLTLCFGAPTGSLHYRDRDRDRDRDRYRYRYRYRSEAGVPTVPDPSRSSAIGGTAMFRS